MSRAATNIINDDVACIQCGYNLRTLDASADCPECGRPVAESLEQPLRPLSKLERLIFCAVLTASIATLAAVLLIQFYVRPGGPPRITPGWLSYWEALYRLFWTAVTVTFANGLVAVSCPPLRHRIWFWLGPFCSFQAFMISLF